jgi:hypothetical protein
MIRIREKKKKEVLRGNERLGSLLQKNQSFISLNFACQGDIKDCQPIFLSKSDSYLHPPKNVRCRSHSVETPLTDLPPFSTMMNPLWNLKEVAATKNLAFRRRTNANVPAASR